MTPAYHDEWLTIYGGDVRDVLPGLASDSVDCIVTSPPYWGLRDYGAEGQLGLERTPEEYVANMVAVFREVRRVLKPSGTCWLNLGDSYAATTKHGGMSASTGLRPFDTKFGKAIDEDAKGTRRVDIGSLKPKDLVGIPWLVARALQEPYYIGKIKSREDRAWLSALVDGEGTLTILSTTSPHGSGNSYPPIVQVRMTSQGVVQKAASLVGVASPAQYPPSGGSNRAVYQWRLSGRRAADIAAELYPTLIEKRKQAMVVWNHQAIRDSYVTKRGVTIPVAALEKQQACRDIIRRLNRGEHVDLPSWMAEPPSMYEPGWYLRADVIWSKPNPMPESVTDRPTKSHEYLFLLTKSPRYFFDADAVREALQPSSVARGEYGHSTYGLRQREGSPTDERTGRTVEKLADLQNPAGRNIRSVWTIATVPYGNVKIGDAEGGHRDTLSPDCPVHSLRAIRRSLRTDGDDALLDRLRSRSPRNGSGPEPMPADGLFANLDLDSPGPDQSTPDSLPAGSSPSPTPGSAHASRTPTQQTSDGGQGSDAGTESHTSHTPSPTIGQDVGELSGPGAPSATGRSGRGSRTSAASEQPDSVSPEPSRHTPGTDAPLGPDEQRPHTSESSSAGDSARRDPAAQTDTGTSGRCTCPDYSASHFAVFPPELPERCIKAGSSERGVCPECGAPWERVVQRTAMVVRPGPGRDGLKASAVDATSRTAITGTMLEPASSTTTGWKPSCHCDSSEWLGDAVPAVILDPFGGSGTVGMVANRLSRRAILIDLNPEYLRQQLKRNAQTPLGLTEGDAA